MKASTCAAKVCFTLRRMTAVSEEEPFFCLLTADLLALRTLLFMDAMIPQSPCEDNARYKLSKRKCGLNRFLQRRLFRQMACQMTTHPSLKPDATNTEQGTVYSDIN